MKNAAKMLLRRMNIIDRNFLQAARLNTEISLKGCGDNCRSDIAKFDCLERQLLILGPVRIVMFMGIVINDKVDQ